MLNLLRQENVTSEIKFKFFITLVEKLEQFYMTAALYYDDTFFPH